MKFNINIKLFEKKFLDISFESFSKKSNKNKNESIQYVNKIDLNKNNNSKPINNNYMGKIKKNLNDIKEYKPVKNIPKKINCTSCGVTTYEDELRKCSKCGKIACTLCGSFDNISNNFLCEECWENL